MTTEQFKVKCDELTKVNKGIKVLEAELEDDSKSIDLLSAILSKNIALRISALSITTELMKDLLERKDALEHAVNILKD